MMTFIMYFAMCSLSFSTAFVLMLMIREHGFMTVLMHPVYVLRLALPFSKRGVCVSCERGLPSGVTMCNACYDMHYDADGEC